MDQFKENSTIKIRKNLNFYLSNRIDPSLEKVYLKIIMLLKYIHQLIKDIFQKNNKY